MQEPTIQTLAKDMQSKHPVIRRLTKRVERVEKENRLLKITGLIALMVIAALFIVPLSLPTPVPKHIIAENFVVQDQAGHSRAIFGVDTKRRTGITLGDKEGNPRLLLYLEPSGETILRMFDKVSKDRINVSLTPDGDPSISILDEMGNLVTALPVR